MKMNDPQPSQKLCPDCRQANMRVHNSVNLEHEVNKVWTCPHCHHRITKVNRAATLKYRAEHNITDKPVRRYNKKEKALIWEFLETQRKGIDVMLDFNAVLDILIEEVRK